MSTRDELLATVADAAARTAELNAELAAVADQRALAIDALYELEAGSGPRRERVAERLRTVEPTASYQTVDLARRRAKKIRERNGDT